MIDMYAAYLKERQGKDLVVSDKGYAVYLIGDQECYIEDIYVKPEFRKDGEASRLADQIAIIAKSKGCTHLTGTVAPGLASSTDSLKVLLAYGMRLHSSSHDRIVFIKEIK